MGSVRGVYVMYVLHVECLLCVCVHVHIRVPSHQEGLCNAGKPGDEADSPAGAVAVGWPSLLHKAAPWAPGGCP